jgi:hypothetical protein
MVTSLRRSGKRCGARTGIGVAVATYLCAILGFTVPGGAQQPSCETCLRLVRSVELSTAAAPVVPSLSQFVTVDTNGRYLVSHVLGPPAVVIYDSTGRFEQLYNAEGKGPGELEYSPLIFPGNGDTLYAFSQWRLIRFDSDFRHIDTKRLERRPLVRAVILPSGQIVSGDVVPDGGSMFQVIAVMDANGRQSRVLESEPWAGGGRALVAAAHDGGFWTLRSNTLELHKYTAAAELQRSVRVADPEFQPWTEGVEGEAYVVPPRPEHTHLVDMGDGAGILRTWVPDPAWKPVAHWPIIRPATTSKTLLYDTVLKRVDLSSGRILATVRHDDALGPVIGTRSRFFSVRLEEDTGHAVTQIWDLRITERH